MDYFAEYILRRRRTTVDKWLSVAYVLVSLALTALICYVALFTGKFMVAVWVIVVAALWYFCYRLICRQSIEYEYIFVNGDLEIDTIYAKRTRRTMVTLRVADISHMARRDDVHYEKNYDDIPQHLLLMDATSNVAGAKVYYADFLYNAERTRLLFEPNDKILEMMQKYNPKRIHIYQEEQKECN